MHKTTLVMRRAAGILLCRCL